MTKFKKTNKVSMDDIFVVSANLAPPTGVFVTATTAFKDLTDGRLGVLSFDFDSAVRPLGEYLQSTDDANEVQAIKIVVGTPVSQASELADIWEVGHKAYLESGIIHKTNIRSVAVKQAVLPTNGAWAGVFANTPEDDVEYKAYIRLRSVRNDRYFGDNDEVVHAIFPAFDFTAAGTVDPLDYLLQLLAYNFNTQSKAVTLTGNAANKKGNRNFVVLGVNNAGGSGTVINDIVVGDVVPFTTIGGVTSNLTITASMVQTFAQLREGGALLAGSTIEVIDTSTAGAAALIDILIVVGLPHAVATAYDDIEQLMVAVDVNLGGGFINAGVPATIYTKSINAQEGTGSGRKWLINWRHTAGLKTHTAQIQPHGDYFSEGKHYIDEDAYYTSYIIEYYDTEETLTNSEVSPKKLVLLFETAYDTTDTVADGIVGNGYLPFTSSDAAAVAGVEAVLTAWLESVRTTGNPFSVIGDAVAGGTYLS